MNYKREYTVSIDEMLRLRAQRQDLSDSLRDLRTEQEAAQGAERGRITRQITALTKEFREVTDTLKGAPPAPVSPEEAFNKMMEGMAGELETLDKNIKEAIAGIVENPVKALKWYGEDLVECAVRKEDLVFWRDKAAQILEEYHGDHWAAVSKINSQMGRWKSETILETMSMETGQNSGNSFTRATGLVVFDTKRKMASQYGREGGLQMLQNMINFYGDSMVVWFKMNS